MMTSPLAAAVAFAVSRGLSMERITEATGLTLMELVQPEARVPDAAAAALWQLLDRAFDGQAIGIEMARVAPMSFFGVLGHVGSCADDLRAALRLFVRYRRILVSELSLALTERDGEAILTMSHPLDRTCPSASAPEATFGLTTRYVREVLGIADALVRVGFCHPRAGTEAVYREFFGVEVSFDAPANILVVAAEALERPIVQSDRYRLEALERHLEVWHGRLVGELAAPGLAPVREAIAQNARQGEFGADSLARRLGMSLRSLQRLVRDHRTSVRELLEQARAAYAQQLLGDHRTSVEEVAFLVGYSTESAFRRAFRRWSGISPAEFRRRLTR